MNLKRQLKKEVDRMVPDVWARIAANVGYEPVRKKTFWTWQRLTVMGASAALVATVLALIPTFQNAAVSASAQTSVELSILPASLYSEDEDTVDDALLPILAYKVSPKLKSVALDEEVDNAVFAKNENAKIILAGIGIDNTVNQAPEAVAFDIVDKATRAGYIEVAGKGNFVTLTTYGDSLTKRRQIEETIYNTVMEYFRANEIYGILRINAAPAPVDFSGYHPNYDDDIPGYRDDYDANYNEHKDDRNGRPADWGNDYDTWMAAHDEHGNGGQHGNGNN